MPPRARRGRGGSSRASVWRSTSPPLLDVVTESNQKHDTVLLTDCPDDVLFQIFSYYRSYSERIHYPVNAIQPPGLYTLLGLSKQLYPIIQRAMYAAQLQAS